ncbi:MAG: LemA protein, partial [Candidatus Amesbacteria bacterium GW2011_GWA2_47_11b]
HVLIIPREDVNLGLMKLGFWKILLGVLIVVGLIAVNYYNSFITQKNAIDGQWKQVEVQYQRRFDLIPNLVEATKGLMKQEQQVFGDLAAARANYSGAQTVDQKAAAATQVEGALGRLLAIFENYPVLKSDQTVLRLQDELAGTENRVATERRRFNELVQTYNTSVSVFPSNLIAKLLGFSSRAYFNSTSGSENAPQIKF